MAKNFTFRRDPAAIVAPVCFTIEGMTFKYQPDYVDLVRYLTNVLEDAANGK